MAHVISAILVLILRARASATDRERRATTELVNPLVSELLHDPGVLPLLGRLLGLRFQILPQTGKIIPAGEAHMRPRISMRLKSDRERVRLHLDECLPLGALVAALHDVVPAQMHTHTPQATVRTARSPDKANPPHLVERGGLEEELVLVHRRRGRKELASDILPEAEKSEDRRHEADKDGPGS